MEISTPHITNLRFLGTFFLVFFVSAVFLFVVDFVPERPTSNLAQVSGALEDESSKQVFPVEQPTRIEIKKIGVDTTIKNPTVVTIEGLDEALLSGAVRYPGSAQLGEDSPMFLFGHQSYLPVVRNQAFKAFNNLQDLNQGDVIRVYSDTAVYEYEVTTVSLVEAEDALIPLESGERTLFLSTCNSFGDPGERYVVEASFTNRITIN